MNSYLVFLSIAQRNIVPNADAGITVAEVAAQGVEQVRVGTLQPLSRQCVFPWR